MKIQVAKTKVATFEVKERKMAEREWESHSQKEDSPKIGIRLKERRQRNVEKKCYSVTRFIHMSLISFHLTRQLKEICLIIK